MNKKIESIDARLETLKTYRDEALKQATAEKRKLQSEIDTLEAELKESEDLDAYKAKQQDLKDARACLEFIKTREAQMHGAVLNNDEKKDIMNDLYDEMEIIQEKYAPDIKKKVLEAVELMDKYTAEIKPLEAMANKALKLNNPNCPGQCIKACEISQQAPDERGVWARFVAIYYSYFYRP